MSCLPENIAHRIYEYLYRDGELIDILNDEFRKTTTHCRITEKDIEKLYCQLALISLSGPREAAARWETFVEMYNTLFCYLTMYGTACEETAEATGSFKGCVIEIEKDFSLEHELRERRFAKPVQYRYIPAMSRNMPYMRRRF